MRCGMKEKDTHRDLQKNKLKKKVATIEFVEGASTVVQRRRSRDIRVTPHTRYYSR